MIIHSQLRSMPKRPRATVHVWEKADRALAQVDLVVHAVIGGKDVGGLPVAVVLFKQLVEPLHAMVDDVDILQISVHTRQEGLVECQDGWMNWGGRSDERVLGGVGPVRVTVGVDAEQVQKEHAARFMQLPAREN